MLSRLARASLAAVALAAAGCSADGNQAVLDDLHHQDASTAAARALIARRADDLVAAAEAVRDAAPAPDADGWSPAHDADAVAAMKAAWGQMRDAYQALEVLADERFPDLDAGLDAAYGEALANGPDLNLFDDHGFTGMHAVERILWSDSTPAALTDREAAIDGYVAAAFPANEEQANDFKNELCERLEHDAEALRESLAAADLDASTTYHIVTGTLAKHLDKLKDAGAGEEPSGYARRSLADLRAGLAAAEATYAAFEPWIEAKPGSADNNAHVAEGFALLETAYASPGDALPEPPPGWSSADPTGDALGTPFGRLFATVRDANDATTDGALRFEIDEAAERLGL